MSQAYDKFTSKVTSSIRATFPSHIRKQDINYTLGYFMAVFKLVDMALIKSTHACLLISDAISYKCVQINDEVLDFIRCADTLASSSSEGEPIDLYKFQFLRIWLEEISNMYSPIVWPRSGE